MAGEASAGDYTTIKVTLFAPALEALESTFRLLEARVPPPKRVTWKDGFVFRYQECTIHQAILQKLARTISGLYAIDALLAHGLFQEQGMIQRALDEISDDIWFLSLGVIRGEITQRHKQYLDYFYAEEFSDPSNILGSHQSRGMVKREKIRAYVNSALEQDSARANIASKIITKAYSGFIHAASPHIMDMYGGYPPRFDINGEFRSLRVAGHANDALNYFLRGLFAMAVAAKAFGDEKLFSEMHAKSAAFQASMQASDAVS
jgi:hypothetical protein